MPPAGLVPAIPASERPQTHALDRAAVGIGHWDRPFIHIHIYLIAQKLVVYSVEF
jgi:hypothetical protein